MPETQNSIPVLENVSTIDRERYFEAALARGKALKNRLFAGLGLVIAALGILMSRNVVVTILGILIALLAWFSPAIIGWRDFGRLKELHPQGSWIKTVRFYPDRIESCSEGGTPTVAAYSDIKREFETRQMYVIDFGKKAPATTFCKDGFTRGTLEELKAFLTEQQRKKYAPKKEEEEAGR